MVVLAPPSVLAQGCAMEVVQAPPSFLVRGVGRGKSVLVARELGQVLVEQWRAKAIGMFG